MGRYDRSIKIAFDKTSGEILEADEVFDIKTDAFEIRRKYHEKNLILSCCECEQDLMVSGSKYDRLHFKHKPGHSYCILADGKLTPQEHERFTEILKAKESDRHKELKNKIGELLKSVNGVDLGSIAIDDKFIIKENGKRRPDVYCKFQNKEIVFEIQLSDLSLGYILSRYEFYKEHGIYLIWILDNFDIHNQGTLERDIKYLTKYHNFFKLDEQSETLKLECEYKYPFLTDDNKLLTKWLKKSVSLSELKYDSEVFQAYYYNFGDNKTKTETLQRKKAEEIKEAERKRIEKLKLDNATNRAKHLRNLVADFRKRKIQNFDAIIDELEDMDEFETKVLNDVLNLKGKVVESKPPLIKWIDEAKQEDVPFLEFILETNKIELDINKPDDSNRTALQAILLNSNIHKTLPVKSLFKAGYKLTDNDRVFLKELQETQKDFVADAYIYNLCNNLTDRSLVDDVWTFSKLLFIIESARQGELIYYNFTGNKWISFANNAIQYYSEYWEYLELSFKRFELWDKLIQVDKNGTFQKKVEKFYSQMPRQKYDFDRVFNDLYPEIEYAN
jgi:competence CoiA-like predicted nuclease